ncbi:MAG: toll/interleukin-1 receptor domain-containing protein, partial [Nitrospirales bacterium]|nr:toll/interleukin-1 receptor domain-containing protein [Nitrospirales bacterium]
INGQIGEYDVFVGVMWRRFGTPTKRAQSGTGEEFQRALAFYKAHGRPTIMFYFRTEAFYTTDEKELRQFSKVARFQKTLRNAGVLYWSFASPLEFERYVREHLMRQLLSSVATRGEAMPPDAQPHVAAVTGTAHGSSTAHAVGFASHSIFLAYSREDRESARTLYRELLAAGHRVWMDVEALLPGQIWHREVEAAVRGSSVFIALLSRHTSGGDGFVAKEIELARAHVRQGLRVIPVRLDPGPVPTQFHDLQTIELYLPDGLVRLLDILQQPPHN